MKRIRNNDLHTVLGFKDHFKYDQAKVDFINAIFEVRKCVN